MHGHQIPQLPSMPVSLQLNRDRAAVRSGPVIARNSPLTLQSNDHSGMLFPHLFHPCEQADKNLQSIQHPAMADTYRTMSLSSPWRVWAPCSAWTKLSKSERLPNQVIWGRTRKYLWSYKVYKKLGVAFTKHSRLDTIRWEKRTVPSMKEKIVFQAPFFLDIFQVQKIWSRLELRPWRYKPGSPPDPHMERMCLDHQNKGIWMKMSWICFRWIISECFWFLQDFTNS